MYVRPNPHPVSTTILPSEDRRLLTIGNRLGASKASVLRAMIRYCLAHRSDFLYWMEEQDRA